jgi:PAS domain S-box-containing protein
MTLRNKTLLIISATTITLILALYISSNIILLSGFSKIEEKDARQNIRRVHSALSSDVSNLRHFVRDWASWNSTYDFMEDGNREYIKANLTDEMFPNPRINFILYFDLEGQIKFSKGFDLAKKVETPIPQDLQEYIADNNRLINHIDTDSHFEGIIILQDGPMVIASCPILTGENKGPIRGTLIMGRYFNRTEVQRLASTTYLPLKMRLLEDQDMPRDFLEAQTEMAKDDSVFIHPVSDQSISGYTFIRDIHDEPCIIMKVAMPRDMFIQAKYSLALYLISMMLIGLTICAVVSLLFEKMIGNRLAHLSDGVRNFDPTLQSSTKVEYGGNDELAFLGASINKMLSDLALSRSELHKSEERFRTIYENAPVLIDAFDENGHCVLWNNHCRNTFGWTIQEITKCEHPLSLLYPEGNTRDEVMRAINTEPDGLFKEWHPVTKDGNVLTTIWTRFRLPDGIIIGLGYDITERKQAEEELRKEKAFSDKIMGSLPGIFYVFNQHGKILRWNRNVGTASEYLNEDIARMNPEEFFLPHERTLVNDTIREAFTTGRSEVDANFLAKNGNTTPYLLTGARFEMDGEVCIAGMGVDITKLKQTEEALRDSEKRFRTFTEMAPVGVFITDADGMITYWNRRHCEITGMSVEEGLGTGWIRGLHPEDRERVFSEWTKAISKRESFLSEYRFIDNNGVVSHTIGQATPLTNTAGQVTGYIGTITDITERKCAEEKRLELERQMQHTQKLESLGVLAGGIAHDFNNILMAVLGYSDLAIRDLSDTHPALSSIREIEKGAKRAADLTRQMLAYSGKGRFVIKSMDVSSLMEDMAHLLRTSIPRKITLNLDLDKDLAFIEADINQMQQIVMNLITNASEAIGDESGVVCLSTGEMNCTREFLARSLINPTSQEETLPPGVYVYFQVSDTGCGMDNTVTARLFEPFFTTKFTGRGLGMAAVLGIVRGHKGAIMLDTQPGDGTTFKVLFPAIKRKMQKQPQRHRKYRRYKGITDRAQSW